MKKLLYLGIFTALLTVSCKKEGCTDETALNYDGKADKNDNSCVYAEDETYTIPTTFVFTDAAGNNTVNHSGQTDRLNQLSEMVVKMKLGRTEIVSAQVLKDMFANVNGNGNGNFTFSSQKQLKDKCFLIDQPLFEKWMDSLALASQDFSVTASNGQAGVLTSGSSNYLLSANGIDYAEVIEKGVMGAVFMYQALNHYFADAQMDVDNTTAVDAAGGKFYTQMEHHWDEAFGYFGVEIDFPSSAGTRFWGKYCNSQDATLGSNDVMMNNFLKGRAAISNDVYADRDAAIQAIRVMWENISANQAIKYMEDAIGYFGTNNAKYLHALSEAYGFARNLRYAPDATRRMSQAEVASLIDLFGDNFWNLTNTDLSTIKSTIEANY
jgi:hypothetical protein